MNLASQIEPLHDLLHVSAREVFVVGLGDSRTNQLTPNEVGTLHLAFIFQFQLAGDRRQSSVDVANTRNHKLLPVPDGSPFGVGDHIFHGGDGQSLAYSRTLIDLFVVAGSECNPFDDLLHVLRQVHLIAIAPRPGLLGRDGDSFFNGGWIVRANL